MYNPYMMNPMGGGMNNYWSPQRMQNAQGMGAYNANDPNGPVPPGMKRQGLFEGGQGSYSFVPDTPGATMGVNDIRTMMGQRNPQQMQQLYSAFGQQPPAGPQGANREGMGWRQSRREQQRQLANQQGRMDQMQNRMNTLQERYKGAGSDQQAGIQGRMDALQGRMDKVQGNMGDPNATGADRAGMGWRKERRQAKNAGTYDPQAQGGQPEPAMYQTPNLNRGQGGQRFDLGNGGFNPWGGMGGMGMGGMGFGGYGGWQSGGGMGGMGEMAYRGGMPQGMFPQPQYRTQEAGQNQGGATPVAPYNPAAQPQAQGGGWNPLTQATGMGNMFETSFGRLVPSSVGNQNVFQKEGDASTLYNFNPTQGWKSMTPEEYRGYGETNYADPRQYAAANPMMQQWGMRNGLIQGMQGTGAYA